MQEVENQLRMQKMRNDMQGTKTDSGKLSTHKIKVMHGKSVQKTVIKELCADIYNWNNMGL